MLLNRYLISLAPLRHNSSILRHSFKWFKLLAFSYGTQNLAFFNSLNLQTTNFSL